MSRFRLIPPVFAALVLAASSCRHVHPVTVSGQTAFQFVDSARTTKADVADALPENSPTPMIEAARPIEPLSKPAYPARALAAHAGVSTVGVRLTIDPQGHVSAVDSSLRYISTPGKWAEEFRAAVEAAVMEWRFRPARIVVVERVKAGDGTDDFVIRRTEPSEWTCDVAFTFTEAGGVVGMTN